MSVVKWLLWPFSAIYWCITSLRNLCFDKGILESTSFNVFVVCVGNLSVGGTGKSPMIEYLIENFRESYNLAVLSRGYKRKTKDFIEVSIRHTAEETGDEPLQFKRKYPNQIICVDADRRNGIRSILKNHPQTEIILLDDAFQHRRVKPDFSILLSTYDSPYFKDFLLPIGRLRESRAGANRADVILFTKCPDKLSVLTKNKIRGQVKPKPTQRVGFSQIKYGRKVISTEKKIDLNTFDDFYLITGIANPHPLLNFLNSHQKTFEHLAFPDHYHFTQHDIEQFESLSKPILTTEKDYVRLLGTLSHELYYLPISVEVDLDLKSVIEDYLTLK